MTIDEAIKRVMERGRERIRWSGQTPFVDEVLVAEIGRLREKIQKLPVTQDGVAMVPTDETVYRILRSGDIQASVGWENGTPCFRSSQADGEPTTGLTQRNARLTFSSREAARRFMASHPGERFDGDDATMEEMGS